jgi:hypothetical protein
VNYSHKIYLRATILLFTPYCPQLLLNYTFSASSAILDLVGLLLICKTRSLRQETRWMGPTSCISFRNVCCNRSSCFSLGWGIAQTSCYRYIAIPRLFVTGNAHSRNTSTVATVHCAKREVTPASVMLLVTKRSRLILLPVLKLLIPWRAAVSNCHTEHGANQWWSGIKVYRRQVE